MNCPVCNSSSLRLSKPKNVLEKTIRLIVPYSYRRCKTCNARTSGFDFGKRTSQKWVSRTINAIGVALFFLLLAGIVVMLLVNRSTEGNPSL